MHEFCNGNLHTCALSVAMKKIFLCRSAAREAMMYLHTYWFLSVSERLSGPFHSNFVIDWFCDVPCEKDPSEASTATAHAQATSSGEHYMQHLQR
jgi:hypothetical protein